MKSLMFSMLFLAIDGEVSRQARILNSWFYQAFIIPWVNSLASISVTTSLSRIYSVCVLRSGVM